jgi:hypothetical protein
MWAVCRLAPPWHTLCRARGKRKHPTLLERMASSGSSTALLAPPGEQQQQLRTACTTRQAAAVHGRGCPRRIRTLMLQRLVVLLASGICRCNVPLHDQTPALTAGCALPWDKHCERAERSGYAWKHALLGRMGLRGCGGGDTAAKINITQSSMRPRSRAQQQRINAAPLLMNQSTAQPPTDARALEGIAPPATPQGPRGSRGRSLGLGQFPCSGSRHPGRPGPPKGHKPQPKRCSICNSPLHRKPACPDALLPDIESERDPEDAGVAERDRNNDRLLGACKTGNASLVQALLAAGADANARDEHGLLDTALHRASYWGHVVLVRMLLQFGAAVDRRNRLDYTALHWACVRGEQEVARELLASAADVGVEDCEGNTPLHFAAREGYQDIVVCLLQGGARVNAVTTVSTLEMEGGGWRGGGHGLGFRGSGLGVRGQGLGFRGYGLGVRG